MTIETPTPRLEEFRITGDELQAKVKELIHEGNIRRIIIRNEVGTTLVEIPLTVGLVGVALVPVWAAIGAIAALATDCSIVVQRRD
jgi:Flp pilus assembly pilin Flp